MQPEPFIHIARHTMAVHLLRRSGNLRMVQKQLGHSNPTTTANMYTDVSFEDMRAVVDGLYDGHRAGRGVGRVVLGGGVGL